MVLTVPKAAAAAVTNMWYPSTTATFASWPTNWVAIPSLNDPLDSGVVGRLDFVGDTVNPGAYWAADTQYFFIRMRVAVSNVTSTTFRDAHWVYIDRVGYTNGAAAPDLPDYALVWDSKSNQPDQHGLELMTGTNLVAVASWKNLQLNDIDGSDTLKIAPPDFNLTGDGYIRTIDSQTTTSFGSTTFIDFAVKWSFFSANTALNTNQEWRLQFGSRNNSTDHLSPDDDIAGGFSSASPVTSSWSVLLPPLSLSAAMDLSVYASANGVTIELWTVDESGSDDIVVYAWIGNDWVEVGRVPAGQVVGEGSNRYLIGADGLSADGAYAFKVVDEAGHVHFSSGAVAVRSLRVEAVQLNMQTLTVTFNTEISRRYVVKVSTDLVHWSTETVSAPTATDWTACSAEPFTAGQAHTQVRVPVNGRAQAFFKIVGAD